MRYFITSVIFCLSGFLLMAQKNVTTVGVQFKPIVPIQFFSLGDVTAEDGALNVLFEPKTGHNFGMVIRRGFTDHFSAEMGISFVRRNYKITLKEYDDNYEETVNIGFVGYELPLQALYYVQLTKLVYLNAAAGVSFDMFPSDVEEHAPNLDHFTYRHAWVRTAMLANVGMEYRSKNSGYFYLGVSYHRPFKGIAVSQTTYAVIGQLNRTLQNTHNGQYLTLDLRYFFNEPAEKKKAKKKK